MKLIKVVQSTWKGMRNMATAFATNFVTLPYDTVCDPAGPPVKYGMKAAM